MPEDFTCLEPRQRTICDTFPNSSVPKVSPLP